MDVGGGMKFSSTIRLEMIDRERERESSGGVYCIAWLFILFSGFSLL